MRAPTLLRCLPSAFILFFSLHLGTRLPAQPVPPDDRDIEEILKKIPAIQRLANGCLDMRCAPLNCVSLQDIQLKVRDARFYMRYLHYWLQRAGESHRDHLKSIVNESLMATERAAFVQKILAWQTYVIDIIDGFFATLSAWNNFSEMLTDPKLFKVKTRGETAELFDKFYEGMKDLEKTVGLLVQGALDKDLPAPIASLISDFGGLTSDQWNDLKSHLSDFKSLMETSAQHGDDLRKTLKDSKGFMAAGQIVARIFLAFARAEIDERAKRIDELLANVLANDRAQSKAYSDMQRIQERRNKVEDAYRALEDLVMISGEGKGQLTRCLMKHEDRCGTLDLGYTSKLEAPEEFRMTLILEGQREQAKNYARALIYFNSKLPAVVQLLSNPPSLPPATVSTLQAAKKNFKQGESMAINFTASACVHPGSWIGIVEASLPHGDDLASSSHTLTGRVRTEGKRSGTVQLNAPGKDGSYEIRMYDSESGAEVALFAFTVGDPSSEMEGVYREMQAPGARPSFLKIVLTDNGRRAEIGSSMDKDGNGYKMYWNGTVAGNTILYMNEVGCGYGPNGLKAGDTREIPFRIVIGPNGNTMEIQHHRFTCDSKGKMTVYPQWDEQLSNVTLFVRER